MKISYKRADKSDIEKVYELNKNHVITHEKNEGINFEEIFKWIRSKVEHNIENYQCIFDGKVKVGYLYLHDVDNDTLELDDLYIFDEYQGKGIGKKVLRHIQGIAEERNKDILLYVFADNHRASELYIRYGYEIIENIRCSRYLMRFKVRR